MQRFAKVVIFAFGFILIFNGVVMKNNGLALLVGQTQKPPAASSSPPKGPTKVTPPVSQNNSSNNSFIKPGDLNISLPASLGVPNLLQPAPQKPQKGIVHIVASKQSASRVDVKKEIEQKNFAALSQAENIVLAKVVRKEYVTNNLKTGSKKQTGEKQENIFTEYKLSILGNLKGKYKPGEEITIEHSGGDFGDGRKQFIVDMPVLREGNAYLLFLAGKDNQGRNPMSPFAGWSNGIYPLLKDETGKLTFADYSGRQSVDFNGGRVKTDSAPMEALDFINNIKTAFQLENISKKQINLSGAIIGNLPTPKNYREQQDQLLNDNTCDGRWEAGSMDAFTNYSYAPPSSHYDLINKAAQEWSSFIPSQISIRLVREDNYNYDPVVYNENEGRWGWNSVPNWVFIGEMNESNNLFGNSLGITACWKSFNSITSATIIMRKDYTWLDETVEHVEQISGDFYLVAAYKGAVLHELGHALGFNHGDVGDTYMSVMTSASPLAKIWDFDRYQLKNRYSGAINYKNIYSSNWKVLCCRNGYSWFRPVAALPDQLPVGVPFPVEVSFGYYGTDAPATFHVGVYFVPEWGWENESTWVKIGESESSIPQNYPEAIVNDLWSTLPDDLSGQTGAIMVFADNRNEIIENDELDNGDLWPRLGNVLTNVLGGWLDLKMPEEVGNDWNKVRIVVDSNGPPDIAELKYSLTPYQPTDNWYANATNVSLPPMDQFHPNDSVDITINNLQNNQTYYVGLREKNVGSNEWKYSSPETGQSESGVIFTNDCSPNVLHPNNPESFFLTNPVEIRWTRQGRCGANVKLELWQNGVFRSTIINGTPSDGEYLWPARQWNNQTTDYKIKIIDLTTGANDFSDYPFSVLNTTYQVRNNSFEWDYGYDFFPGYNADNMTANDLKPDGWEQSAWPGVIDGTTAVDGGYSVKIDKTGNNGYHAYVSEDLPVTFGKRYRVSGMVKTACEDALCFGTITTECLKADHTPKFSGCDLNTQNPVKVSGYHDWQYIENTVMADTREAAFVKVLCYNTPTGNAQGIGTVWCDNINVEEIIEGGGKGGKEKFSLPGGGQ